jgi:hypothetical protein
MNYTDYLKMTQRKSKWLSLALEVVVLASRLFSPLTESLVASLL